MFRIRCEYNLFLLGTIADDRLNVRPVHKMGFMKYQDTGSTAMVRFYDIYILVVPINAFF